MTRLLFATDFHGNPTAYQALVRQAEVRRPDAVVLGGDLLPFPMLGEDAIEAQRRFVRSELRETFHQIRAIGAAVFAIHGNDDWAAAVAEWPALVEEGLFYWIHGRSAALSDGWSIAGLGLVPVTPFFMKDFDRKDSADWVPAREPPTVLLSDGGVIREGDLTEVYARPTLADELARLARVSAPERTVYVVHTPPAECALDVMHGGNHIGSQALRRFLEQHRPPVSLHGHVHESPQLSGAIHDVVGSTLAVNPGASVVGFRGAWVDLERRTVQRVCEDET